MYSSSPQNQGSLSSLLALSPPASSAREARSANMLADSPNNFGNMLEHVRQSERQQERQLERQKLASVRADQAAREKAGAEGRDSHAATRSGPEPHEPKPSHHAEHPEETRADFGSTRSSTHTDETKQEAGLAKQKGINSNESGDEAPVPTLANENPALVADPQNTTTVLLSGGDLLVANSVDGLANSGEAELDEEASSILLDPNAGAEAQSALLAGPISELNPLDPAATKAGVLAASGSPLAAQMLTKGSGSTSSSVLSDALAIDDPASATDTLLAKTSVIKTNAGGESESVNLTQGKQGDLPLAVNSKELFSRLLAGQTESSPLTREHAAALPISAQAAPALDAVSRAIESLTPAGRGFVVQSSVAVPVGQPQWSQAVGDRVLWLAAQNITSAELRLDPPELGPMQVRVSVQNDQVQVTFTSPHANVREALDQGAARLRELFGEQGLNANVDVSDQALSRRQENGGGGEGGRRRGSGGGDSDVGEEVVAEVAVANIRLVDHYA